MKIERQLGSSVEITPIDEWGDKNMIAVDVEITSAPDSFKILYAKIQGFVGREGVVTKHKEDTGVIEIYFPLSGRFSVLREDRIFQLKGPFQDLRDFKLSGELTISDCSKESKIPELVVKTIENEEYKIQGFVISPTMDHATALIKDQNTACRYLAIKVKCLK